MSKHLAALFVIFSLCPSCLCGEPTLEERLAPLAKAHKGKVAIAVKHLTTGESYYLNADEPMPTASLIKVAVMIEVYQQADEGKFKLTDKVTLHDSDKVPGSGILTQYFSDGASFSVRDAVRLMMAVSDNTATNLLLDKTGIASVNKRMEAMSYPNTKINAKVFRGSTTSVDPARTKKYGLGSTTAREMVGIMETIQATDTFRPPIKQCLLTHLRSNSDKDKFPRFLPPGTVVAHKDGSVNDARTDAGLIHTPGGIVAVCVLTNDNADKSWRQENAGNVLCAKVAKEVYDHFTPAKTK
jgi:D-alanyl-D-alanine carboxypeptidase (penicillin-binding protein 5/6)/beta-lactamase class A